MITLIIGAALTLMLVAILGTLALAVALSEEDATYEPSYPDAHEPYPGEPMPPGPPAPPPPEPGDF